LNSTLVIPKRYLPMTVTEVPAGPLTGPKRVMLDWGGGSSRFTEKTVPVLVDG
jgi:hypothetical protein